MRRNALLVVAVCAATWPLLPAGAPALEAQGRGQGAPIVCQGSPAAAAAAPAPAAAAAPQGEGAGAPAPAAAADKPVTAIPGVIAAGARFTQVFQTVGNNVDGVVAAPDGSLLATQEDNNAVLRIDKDDRASVFLATAPGAGSLSFDRRGRLFTVQRMPQRGTPASVQPTAPKTAGLAMLLPQYKVFDTFADGSKWTGRPSDVSADGTGGAYFTQGCVYYASADGKITLVGENVRSNGIVLSEDDKRLYVTNGSSIVAFDVQGPGKLTNQREFAKLHDGGNGDGLAVDTEGRLYVAAGPGVQVYARDGKYVGVIPTPTSGRPTGQAFAGPDRRTLYVVVQATTDFNGQAIAGRTVYRIPVLARGPADRSK
jgi:gluconolactonase